MKCFSLLAISLLSCFFLLINCQNSTSSNSKCSLTGHPNSNPFPSLIKCYKYNSDSCCATVHDNYLTGFVSSLLTSSCQRRYSELEDFVCYGCNPKEYIYTDPVAQTVNFCLSFALSLWNGTVASDLDNPTTRFDNCGLLVGSGSPPGLQALTSKPYIIPSEMFSNFTSFVTAIGVPFFDGYTIQVIDDIANPNVTNCFSDAFYLSTNYLGYFLLLIFTFLSL